MKDLKSISIIVVVAALVWGMLGCTPREAAVVGAKMGRQAGTALGSAAVAIEETFNTVGDVLDANPRRDHQVSPQQEASLHPTSSPGTEPEAVHYYKAEVLIKTNGPAEIASVDVGDTEDVTQFWGEDH